MSLEIIKDIPGFESYQITSWGRVLHNGKELHPYKHHKGYLRVDLHNGSERKHFKVHRLVAGAFIPNPLGKPQVNHIDGNKANNSFSNLEWVTNKENDFHARRLRELANTLT